MSDDIRLINIKDACNKVSLSRTAVNKLRNAGRFPRAVNLGDKRVAFVSAEIDEWIKQRIAARDASASS